MTQDCAILNRHADVVCRRWDIVRLCVLLSHCVSAGRRVNNVVVDDLCFRPHCIPRHLENRRVFDRDAGGEKTRKHVGAALRSRRFKAKMTRNASCELRPRSLGYSSREISHGLQLTLRGLFVQFGIAPMPSTITCWKHKTGKNEDTSEWNPGLDVCRILCCTAIVTVTSLFPGASRRFPPPILQYQPKVAGFRRDVVVVDAIAPMPIG